MLLSGFVHGLTKSLMSAQIKSKLIYIMVKLVTHWNISLFGSRCNYFKFKNRNKTCAIFQMDCWGTSVE